MTPPVSPETPRQRAERVLDNLPEITVAANDMRIHDLARDVLSLASEVERLHSLTEGDPTSIYHEAAAYRAEVEVLRGENELMRAALHNLALLTTCFGEHENERLHIIARAAIDPPEESRVLSELTDTKEG